MAAVDKFVLLTQCQFSREHYQHRFRHQDTWYTMGVTNVRHPDLIVNRTYADPQEDWDKIKRRLPNYSDWLGQFDACIVPSLWETNYGIILALAAQLGIKTQVLLDPISNCTGTDRLVEICRALHATTYLAGASGASYMDLEKFKAAGITVEHQVAIDKRHIFET